MKNVRTIVCKNSSIERSCVSSLEDGQGVEPEDAWVINPIWLVHTGRKFDSFQERKSDIKSFNSKSLVFWDVKLNKIKCFQKYC